MSMMLTELAPQASLYAELSGATSGPSVLRRTPRRVPANDVYADAGWLNAPRGEDPSRPIADYDVRLARTSEAANDRVATKERGPGLVARLRSALPHVDTAFLVIVLAAEFAVGSYCAAQAVESLWLEPAAATQTAQH